MFYIVGAQAPTRTDGAGTSNDQKVKNKAKKTAKLSGTVPKIPSPTSSVSSQDEASQETNADYLDLGGGTIHNYSLAVAKDDESGRAKLYLFLYIRDSAEVEEEKRKSGKMYMLSPNRLVHG